MSISYYYLSDTVAVKLLMVSFYYRDIHVHVEICYSTIKVNVG